jgi:hypothetical protein
VTAPPAAKAPSRKSGKKRVSQAKVFEGVGYKPHAGQRRILASTTRFNVCSAGRRFGKSENGGHKLTVRAFEAFYRKAEYADMGKRMEYWIIGPNYSDAEKEFRILYNDVMRLEMPVDRPGTYNDPLGGNMHLSLWNGIFQVHAKSGAHPESLVGEGLHGALLVEAAKLKERVWTKFIRPTLNDFKGWADFTSTPEGKNWFYELWQRGLDPNQEAWSSFRAPAWENPHVYPRGAMPEALEAVRARMEARLPVNQDYLRELDRMGLRIDPEIVQLMMDLTEEAFNQEIGADFSDFVGKVFKRFDEEEHVTDLAFNPEWATYAAVDYGFTNPNVWLLLQVDPFGERVHVLDEVYESGLSPVEFAQEIRRRGLCPEGTLAFYPDPALPGDTKVLESMLRVRSRGGTGGELKDRLDIIRDWLKPWPAHDPNPRPRLLFDRKCSKTINDFNEYRYPEKRGEQDKNAPENPMKKNDHGPEALGRFFAGHFGTAPKQHRRSRVRSANMGR